MAEFVVKPLVSMLVKKASSFLVDQYKVMDGMEKHREILERDLAAVLHIIEDAEKKACQREVGVWLEALKKVAYEANDVFDELKYEVLRRDAKKKGHYKKFGFDIVSLVPAHNAIVFRYRMGKKLCRIVKTIEGLVTRMNTFGFKQMQQAPLSKQWRVTDSIILDSDKDIVSRSRDEEKKKIMSILIGQASDRDLIVLPIVGMGGLGKTSFAQLVYNDPAIKEYFQLQRWCCVSDDFDIVKIASSICQTNEINREKALQELQKEVSGKRYLIVLDDVWNEDVDKWEKLKTCLKHGAKGSAILTTTRNAQVAQIMKTCTNGSHNLGNLDKVFLKEIFEKRAFCLQKPNEAELSDMVEKILDRCRGSPLAAKVFGSMLSNKTSMKEWKNVLTRSIDGNEKTGTFAILKLSYDELPSHLKQCFAFCAVFPKDYEIDVEILIQLWMAHDFIPLVEGDNLEKVGREIFNELTWRSFFQEVKQTPPDAFWGEIRSRTVCKIHDLMHDIASSVMGNDCLTIVDKPDQAELLTRGPTRHLFSSYEYIRTLLDDYLKKYSPALQTLLYTDSFTRGSTPHLSKNNYLRALQLFEECKWTKALRPRHLQHLRYLDLSRNQYMDELPNEISTLYNLQTLNLTGCRNLGQLPKDMKYMTKLRHLYTNGCTSLKCMPPDLGQLTYLQTLTYFVVGSSPCCSTIGELQDLNLGGELKLSGLQYVTEQDAKACSLGNKETLTHLSLEWSEDSSGELNQHRDVLDALKPQAVLEFLRIHCYRGTGFPAWVISLSFLEHLTELCLVGCTMCEEFPQFGQFKALEVLVLKRLDKLRSLCCHNSSSAFPALKDLRLGKLENFERWMATEEELAFPVLEKVQIKNCPKLTTLPEASKLKSMDVEEDKAMLSLSIFESRHMSCLSDLWLSVGDTEATAALELDQEPEVSLSELHLHGCSFLFRSSPLQAIVGVWKRYGQLGTLWIESCDMLIYWPEEEFRSLVALEYLTIRSCSNLKGPTKVNGYHARGRDQLLPNLKGLTILGCGSLTELFVLPPSLMSIEIRSCHILESILRQDDRELENMASTSLPEQSPSPRINPLPSIQVLVIDDCKKLCFVSAQLDGLRILYIWGCDVLESLDCLGDLPLLEELHLESCKHLVSVPGNLGNYPALRELVIKYCPAINMKALHRSLQRRLDSLEHKDISDAGSCDPDEGHKLENPGNIRLLHSAGKSTE